MTCIFMYVWIIPVSHFSSVLLRYCRSIQGAMFVKLHVSINLVPADQRYMFFSKFLHQLVVESRKFRWNPKSIRLHFTLVPTKKSLLTFVGSPKRQHFLEPTFFFDPPLDLTFLFVFRQFILGSWCWSGGLREISSLGALNIKWHLRKLDPYEQHWKWKGDHHVIHETGIIWDHYINDTFTFFTSNMRSYPLAKDPTQV